MSTSSISKHHSTPTLEPRLLSDEEANGVSGGSQSWDFGFGITLTHDDNGCWVVVGPSSTKNGLVTSKTTQVCPA